LKYAFAQTLIYHPKFSLGPILHMIRLLILIPRKIADHYEAKTSPYSFISFLESLAISFGQMNARDSGLLGQCRAKANPDFILRNDFPSYHAYY
jgi:hypothetical protein